MSTSIEYFVYKMPGTAAGNRPGAHRSKSRGAGMNFAAHARLFDQPDPRRLDLRASLQDIRGDWLVRSYQQRSSIAIKAIIDVSASMRFGNPGKLAVAAGFLRALGNSAHGYGDSVTLLAYDNAFREDLYLPPGTGRARGETMANIILESSLTEHISDEASGLGSTVANLAGERGLVFLLSDFHWPLEQLKPALQNLSAATVVPLVVWDKTETMPPAAGQWLPVKDLKTKQKRHLWLRESTRAQWLNNVDTRRTEIKTVFEDHDSTPVFFDSHFDAEKLSRYFLENVA